MLAQIVLFDGFDPLDVVAPYEVLHAGGLAAGGALTVELVSAEGSRDVPSGIPALSLRATGRLDPARARLVVLPGAAGRMPGGPGPDGDDSIPAVLARALGTGLPPLLDEAMGRPEVCMATVCGGSLLLAMAGLIGGRPAVTHHEGMGALADAGASPVAARVVDDGDLVTAGGVTSGLDLGLYLLERELGPETALSVERLFAHERRGVVWRSAA
ncbi:DJ-1/PfpI family protein [Streptomyces sp. NPDC001822]|uniref:DJ-1/PfpI family protein n=1 Tax=Streptomyces sp. NPDC001822 TaxID=3364614 RepID=UPI00369FD54C